MTEILAHQIHDANEPGLVQPSPEQAVAACEAFIGDSANSLGSLFGIPHLNVQVGKGWATNLETGDVTADPRFFLEKGYTPEMAGYALVHEVSAHLREVVFAPALTREVKKFVKQGEAESIFHNILSDVAGNNLTHAVLPNMAEIADELYQTKLFPETDYRTSQPRHLQFLYKVIRQEMAPDSETQVLPEVDALIAEFRNFEGKGDLIKYSTQVAKSAREAMPAEERFTLWRDVIYPRWQELVEQDEADPNWQKAPGEQGDGEPSDQPADGEGQPVPDFSDAYSDYRQDRHPEPMSDEEHEAIHKAVRDKQRQEQREDRQKARTESPEYRLDQKIRQETGHSLADQRQYQTEVLKWRSQITEMRELFRSVIHEQVAQKRTLRGAHTEGALLSPDRLAQTYIDVQTGSEEPAAFQDYERTAAERTLVGKTDYVFVFDRSGSMGGNGKSEAAAAAVAICLEGLDGMQRDVKAAEQEAGVTLDLDIRTALYTFNDEVKCTKQLSHGLTAKERLDSYGDVRAPGGGNADSTVLGMMEELDTEIPADRRKIVVMVADGEADNTTAARASVDRLRQKGWQVYGISIGSDAAVELYKPTSRRVDDPTTLPSAMQQLIQETI